MGGGWSLNLRRSSHVLKRISPPLGKSRCVGVEKSNKVRPQANIMHSQYLCLRDEFTSSLPANRVGVQLEKRVNNADDFEIKKHVFAIGKSRADFTFYWRIQIQKPREVSLMRSDTIIVQPLGHIPSFLKETKFAGVSRNQK